MSLAPGTLRVKLEYAKDIKDCDFFGRQDPYVRLRVGDQERKSRVCKNGGTQPVWDETFDFVILHENTVDLELLDADRTSHDDVIGRCAVSISKTREHGRDSVRAPVISGKKYKKPMGFISVQLEFIPKPSNTRPAAA
ncbi:hypothetical protein Vafri_5332 [Volvox africanus]|nr:hypothetical protein Vafri_5332 [Volvox africanus]